MSNMDGRDLHYMMSHSYHHSIIIMVDRRRGMFWFSGSTLEEITAVHELVVWVDPSKIVRVYTSHTSTVD